MLIFSFLRPFPLKAVIGGVSGSTRNFFGPRYFPRNKEPDQINA